MERPGGAVPALAHADQHIHIPKRNTRVRRCVPPAPIEIGGRGALAEHQGVARAVLNIREPSFRTIVDDTIIDGPWIAVQAGARDAGIHGDRSLTTHTNVVN